MSTLFWALFFGTFALEDAALVSAVALVAQSKISLTHAFWACFLGISIGDIGVYSIGFIAAYIKPKKESGFLYKFVNWFKNFKHQTSLSYMIVASRAIPGTRLPTYLLAGFVRYSFIKFCALTFASVLAWVIFAFTLGHSAQKLIADHWFYSTALFLILFLISKSCLPDLLDYWKRRSLKYAWKRWLSFEFWPAGLFYIPIVPRYIFLALKYRSFFLPFYANPSVPHAGFLGESKWDFYRDLCGHEASLNTKLLTFSKGRNDEVAKLISEKKFTFPFILKPDIGQRGFAVRVIKNETDLNAYLEEAQFDLMIQDFCDYKHEAGIFYYRLPIEKYGHILSITDKEFPFVVGNGVSRLGDLILKDKRAQIIANTYFSRFGNQLNNVPNLNQKIYLSTCGNHCQGAIFLNGHSLETPELLNKIEEILTLMPDFYFGRFDIRYESVEALKQGLKFKIVELNGAGSEATHIWDAKTSLLEAYRVLYRQWGLLFKIGYQVKNQGSVRYAFSFSRLVKDLKYMNKRNKNLSTSS